MNRIYSPNLKKAKPPRFGARLSPRRKLYLQKLLSWLLWNGGKVLMDDRRYFDLREDCELDKFGVNQALDDGFALGLLDCHMAGGLQVVTLLSSNLEDAA